MVRRVLGSLGFGLLLVPSLCYLGLVLFRYEFQSYRFWHNAKRICTYYDGERWVSVEE